MMISQYSHIILAFIIYFAYAAHGGRSLHKNFRHEAVALSRLHFHDDAITVKAVSHAIAPTYTGKTNESDVEGLVALCNAYSWLLEDNTDPCLPPVWTWIQCNSDPRPRVIALNLDTKLLFGELPDFSSMDALQTIDLSNNAFVEVIPSFLGTFPHLKELNLAYNFFNGQVPDSLACSKTINVNVTGNTNLYVSKACSPPSNKSPTATASTNNPNIDNINNNDSPTFQMPPERKTTKKNKQPVIIGSTVSAILLLWIAGGGFAVYHQKSKAAAAVAAAAAGNAPTRGVEEAESGAATPMEERAMNKTIT